MSMPNDPASATPQTGSAPRSRPRNHRRKGPKPPANTDGASAPASAAVTAPPTTGEGSNSNSNNATPATERKRPPRHRAPRKKKTPDQQDGSSSGPSSDPQPGPSNPPLQPITPPNCVNHPPAGPSAHGHGHPHAHTHPHPHPHQHPHAHPQHSRRGRGRGGARGGGRGVQAGQGSRMVPGSSRTFGGQLSRLEDDAASTSAEMSRSGSAESHPGLRANVPEFQPGQPYIPNDTTAPADGRKKRGKKPQAKPMTEEELAAEDLTARIQREIDQGDYECMICYANVTRRQKVWYCRCCWVVYHLNCVQKWGRQGLSQVSNRPVGADGPPTPTWRCPACNNSSEELPSQYTCWCEKTVNPEVSAYLPPHSCGQTCGKQRESPRKCPHNCNLMCHAGPCPPCTAMGPMQSCYCAKEEEQRRCRDTDYENGWSCGQVCGEMLPCGEHFCEQPCHPGLCGACEMPELLRCFCGNEMKEVRCSDKGEPKISRLRVEGDEDGEPEEWEGWYSCGKLCERFYDCGVHKCEKKCHPLDENPAHCPLSPDVITNCPCGKTPLPEILASPRPNCEAPIPTCNKPCNKTLKCGHTCTKSCHTDACGACLIYIDVLCRCGKTSSRSLCHQGEPSEPPQCMRTCRVNLNCGRHECGEKCCSGEQKAAERIAAKKRTRGPAQEENFEPEHICTRICGKQLKCGLHTCPMLCHRGHCGTCLEASFEELTCNCGRTSIQPPVPCGSKPPVCRFPCTRRTSCGHPQVPHDCHPDEKSCPKCPYLVDKLCICGKKTIKSLPCSTTTISCGTPCSRPLPCGSHRCPQICHSGPCAETCSQPCRKPKSCGHLCPAPCHAPFQCSADDKPCPDRIQLSCACGGIVQETRCGGSKTNPAGNKKELKCTDACRARRLAQALHIDPDKTSSSSTTPEALYSTDTISAYQRDRKWAAAIETRFRSFLTNPDLMRLQFQPMRRQNREFLHLLAEDLGLESESLDPEPYRSVVVRKPGGFHYKPRKTISEFIAAPKPTTSAETQPSGLQQLKKARTTPLSNALQLTSPRVGLLTPELEKELSPVLSESQLRFTISWTAGGDEVLLTPKPSSLTVEQVDAEIKALAPKLRRRVAQTGLAGGVEAVVEKGGKVVVGMREGWNVVGSGSGAKNPWTTGVGGSGSGLVGGGRNRFDMTPIVKKTVEVSREKKVEKKVEEVLESWDMELDEELDEEDEQAKAQDGVVGDEGKGKGKEGDEQVVVDEEKGKDVEAPATNVDEAPSASLIASEGTDVGVEAPSGEPSAEPAAAAVDAASDATEVTAPVDEEKQEEVTV